MIPTNRYEISLNFRFSSTLPKKLELKSFGLQLLFRDTIEDSIVSIFSFEDTVDFFLKANENYD